MNNTPITTDSLELFKALAKDAGNWGGTPMIGGAAWDARTGNGNLTDLEKRGLLSTFESDGCTFVEFTDKGVAFAESLGIKIVA
jgi:predicted transcriptional regulator